MGGPALNSASVKPGNAIKIPAGMQADDGEAVTVTGVQGSGSVTTIGGTQRDSSSTSARSDTAAVAAAATAAAAGSKGACIKDAKAAIKVIELYNTHVHTFIDCTC
jgi:hypothetical protein